MDANQKKLAEGVFYTDQYELTMSQLYYRMGLHKKQAQFEHFFRSYPNYDSHQAGYCVNAGLEWLLDWMNKARFGETEIEYMRSQKTNSGERLFADDFLDWLSGQDFLSGTTMRAIPEGRVVHPNVPLTVMRCPLAMGQILESSLLNHLNYQTLVATKAARVRQAGRGGLMVEFGLRRGQDRGANAGARAALIGGADFTSNTGISHVLGYPPKGTHAHSMVQAFMAIGEGELGAFEAYADVYPDNCLFLVDTIDTLKSGVPNAIKVFEKLRKKGHKPLGIRLDSGDLAYLAIQSAKMLNEAGFEDVTILLSNQLDELVIWQIITEIQNEASKYGVDPDHLINRLAYGVGTRLITSRGQGALDGVYKLTAIKEKERWVGAIKVSETPSKTLTPGFKNTWRIYNSRGKATADLMSLEDEKPDQQEKLILRHPTEPETRRVLKQLEISQVEPLLVDVIKDGKMVYEKTSIDLMREKRDKDLDRLDSGVKRLVNPHRYHVSLTQRLWELKRELIEKQKAESRN